MGRVSNTRQLHVATIVTPPRTVIYISVFPKSKLTARHRAEFALKRWNGAGENRTPVPKQSTIHVYANSQMFNFGTASLHLTN